MNILIISFSFYLKYEWIWWFQFLCLDAPKNRFELLFVYISMLDNNASENEKSRILTITAKSQTNVRKMKLNNKFNMFYIIFLYSKNQNISH